MASAHADEAQQLNSHVLFLARPALKGRKPGTTGSRAARHYIGDRYREYGLLPWGVKKSYELSFGYGRNVVGFLPGSDPNWSNEIVLVSAHYDHLGKDSKGRICPGAADNASGVAALLETARELSRAQARPSRSILFAAFDCEEKMLLGSFAFLRQEESRLTNLVAVVNIDMLGRDLLDVVRHTVFVAGTEAYPGLAERVSQAGADAGIRVLPLGTDLVGPRGDHAAFESRGIPCLFFSCGTFRDYHQPEDTVERLNVSDIQRAAQVIRDTVKTVCGSQRLEPPHSLEIGYSNELGTVQTVLSEVNQNRSQAGVSREDAEAFTALAREAAEFSAGGRYDREQRRRLILDATGILAPYFLPADISAAPRDRSEREAFRLMMQYLQQFYLDYKDRLMDGYGQLVGQLLKYRPGLVRGMPRFNYELYEIPQQDIRIAPCPGGKYSLDALASFFNILAEVKSSKFLINSFAGYLSSGLDPLSCEGTREQLEDYCLLRLRECQSNTVRFAAMKKVAQSLSGAIPEGGYPELLATRLCRGGLDQETAWIAQCLEQDAPDLALQALAAAKYNRDARISDALGRIISSVGTRSDVRAAAIQQADDLRNPRLASALCERVGDRTPVYRTGYAAMTRDDYPFSDRLAVRALLQVYERQLANSRPETLGDLAQRQLRKLTKHDFGKDPRKWREWVHAHSVSPRG